MPTLPLYQVDAFVDPVSSDRRFTGNPAAVCPLAAPLPAPLMQEIAAENNLSETAFFHPADGGGFALRWFTPAVEVDLCGHATLASAFVLMTALEPTRKDVVFHTRSGPLSVRRASAGTPDDYVLDLPARGLEPAGVDLPPRVAAALRAEPPPVEVWRGPRTVLALFDDEAAVRRLAPDMTAVAALGASVCATAPGSGAVDFVSRYFAPASGIPEDPVTGSAHCLLAPYWAGRLGKGVLAARQVSSRGGTIRCEIAGDRVLLAGQARLVVTGTFHY